MQKPLKFLRQSYTWPLSSSSPVSSVFRISFLPISLFFLTLLFPHLCLAVDVSLGWTANAPEENVQGYKVYMGTLSRYDDNQQLKDNFHYEYVVDLETKLSCSLPDMDNCEQLSDNELNCADLDKENPICTFLDLEEDTTFYFTATAFNDISESDYSDEAAYLPTNPEEDFDGDGISDEDEINIYGTNLFAADSDDDGIDDGDELAMWGIDWDADFDGDNVINLLDNDSDGDGILDGDDSNPASPPSLFCSIASFADEWYTVQIAAEVSNPVVIVGPPSYNDSDPGVIRLKNVADHSFDIRFQEWNYLDGSHALEDASWLALEPGRYEMADGTIFEVGTFSMDNTGEWFDVDFLKSFDGTPALFLTIQTSNGSDPVTVRARDVYTSFFSAALFEEEAYMDSGHTTEVVGYLALYSPDSSGTLTINGQSMSYEIDSVVTNHSFQPIFDYEIFIEEEQSWDYEIYHLYETVSVLRLNNSFFSQDVSALGFNTAAIRYQKIE